MLPLPALTPQFLRDRESVDASLLPPLRLVARAVQGAVMQSANRNRELVAHFAANGAQLGKAEVMCVARPAAADQARSRGDKSEMLLVAPSPWLADCECTFVNSRGCGEFGPNVRPAHFKHVN